MARPMHAAIAASLLIAVLAGCASAAQEPEVEEGSVGTTPSATPEPSPEPTTFTTQNGTASFALPTGWSVDDASELQPRSNHGGPIWQNAVQVLEAGGVVRATYSDGYGDDVGAAEERGVVQSLPMPSGLHAAAWWSSAGDGAAWEVAATVVGDPAAPQTSVTPEGYDRLHSFSATLADVPQCASVVDEPSAVACLEAPGTTTALELLATLELEPLPWDAMPDDVDPQADVPWLDFVSDDGALSFAYPASWSLLEHDFPMLPGETFVTLVTPDGYQALDVRRTPGPPHQTASWCDASHGGWEPFELVAAERIELVTDPMLLPVPVELATFAFGASDGIVGVAILPAESVVEGCFEPIVEVGSGVVEVSTPYATDATGLIYERFPGGVGFVGSSEHEVMLDVARTVMVDPA